MFTGQKQNQSTIGVIGWGQNPIATFFLKYYSMKPLIQILAQYRWGYWKHHNAIFILDRKRSKTTDVSLKKARQSGLRTSRIIKSMSRTIFQFMQTFYWLWHVRRFTAHARTSPWPWFTWAFKVLDFSPVLIEGLTTTPSFEQSSAIQ